MRRYDLMLSVLLPLLILSGCGGAPKTEAHALERLEAYADAIDRSYKEPEKIYALLAQEVRDAISEADFCAAFEKERSYPYITPLYIMDPVVTLSDDGMSGTAVYDQAARIIGMHYTVGLVYENGDYYILDWEEFLDGSYLEKFENVPYSLDWYYDTDALDKGD